MAAWTLVPCLVSLRNEFNALAPERDRSSDGSIGDQAHADRSSDHNPDETGATPSEDSDSRNEVHAIDIDVDLREPGWTMDKAVRVIVTRHRDGLDNRLQNVIYNGRIWSASWGWTARAYHGSNPHDHHAHFSSKYTAAAEANTRPWGLLAALNAPKQEDDDMAGITQERFTELLTGALHTGKIGRSGQTFAQALDQIDQILNRTTALAEAFSAYVAAERIDDATVNQRLADLRSAIDQVREAVEPPV